MAKPRPSTVPTAPPPPATEAPAVTTTPAPPPAPAPPAPSAPTSPPPRVSLREQVEHWFTYHPPTAEKAPKYEEITRLRNEAEAIILAETSGRTATDFVRMNDAIKAFVLAIIDNAPGCADTTAAIRCARLARNAANQLARRHGDGQLQAICIGNLWAAQWQANAAIALDGV